MPHPRPRPQRLRLRPSRRQNKGSRSELRSVIRSLPLNGSPLRIFTLPGLAAHHGRLLSCCRSKGTPVYAAAFIRRREIVLDSALCSRPALFRLILLHELFHFVWVRLSNRRRQEFAALLLAETSARARGELGESSSVKKARLNLRNDLAASPLWRDYVCESFCDTAAWLYSGLHRSNAFTLASRWRKRRQGWFQAAAEGGWRC